MMQKWPENLLQIVKSMNVFWLPAILEKLPSLDETQNITNCDICLSVACEMSLVDDDMNKFHFIRE